MLDAKLKEERKQAGELVSGHDRILWVNFPVRKQNCYGLSEWMRCIHLYVCVCVCVCVLFIGIVQRN